MTFSLVDQNNNKVGARVEGLLLSNGGTVCDDSFSDNSADAICRKLGFPESRSWRNANLWSSFQETFEIALDDVLCSSGEWTSCTYSLENNCGHNEDIYLECDGTGKFLVASSALWQNFKLRIGCKINRVQHSNEKGKWYLKTFIISMNLMSTLQKLQLALV